MPGHRKQRQFKQTDAFTRGMVIGLKRAVMVAVYACGVDVEKGPIRQQLWNAPPCDNVESWVELQRGEQGEPGYLVKHFPRLQNGRDAITIFVPLCGKAMDLKWLYDQGHSVIGVEIVLRPILDFFKEHGLHCDKLLWRDLDLYQVVMDDGTVICFDKETVMNRTQCNYHWFLCSRSPENEVCVQTGDGRLKIYNCDILVLPLAALDEVQAVWDRGAFVALEKEDRIRYIELMTQALRPGTRYLLDTVVYDDWFFSGSIGQLEMLVEREELLSRNAVLETFNVAKLVEKLWLIVFN
ncbi:TPMT [Cordylochernes scorpioides]|uniref:TPMT n=1 Tax=Cordylochernes scorpioides TaxID=51811 RepID=A0ABY6LGJ4_9ARAC|nr:TPMT [Cordylochernes scorpioides]